MYIDNKKQKATQKYNHNYVEIFLSKEIRFKNKFDMRKCNTEKEPRKMQSGSVLSRDCGYSFVCSLRI